MPGAPIFPVLLSFAVGIVWAELLGGSAAFFFLISTLMLAIAGIKRLWRSMLIHPASASLGCAWTLLGASILNPHDLRLLASEKPEFVVISGEFCRGKARQSPHRPDNISGRYEFAVTRLHRGGESLPASGRIMVVIKNLGAVRFHSGDQATMQGVLSTPHLPFSKDMFNYREFLRRRQIFYLLEVQNATEVTKISGMESIASRAVSWAQKQLGSGLPQRDVILELIWGMALGVEEELVDSTDSTFMRSGTIHIFAISGFHIALVGGFILCALKVARVPNRLRYLAAAPALWVYIGLTGWQPSAVRSGIMMTVLLLGWALPRPVQIMNSLAAAGLLILVWDPQQLFSSGFQLSFGVVFFLALLVPGWERWVRSLCQADPFLPEKLVPRWQTWLQRLAAVSLSALGVSIIAWGASLPLIAYYFQIITPISLLSNLVIVPLSSLTLICNLITLCLGPIWPWAGSCLNHAAWFMMQSMLYLSDLFGSLPGAWFYVSSPGLIGVFCLYSFFAGICFLRVHRIASRFLFGFGAATSLVWLGSAAADMTTTLVYVIPFKNSHAVYVDSPGRKKDLLLDCGDNLEFESLLLPFLRAKGVNSIPGFLVTHGDKKYVGAATNVLATLRPQIIYHSGVPQRSRVYRDFLNLSGSKAKVLRQGDRLGDWLVVHPDGGEKVMAADDAALVILGQIGVSGILLATDMSLKSQQSLVLNPTAGLDVGVARFNTSSGISPGLLEHLHCKNAVVVLAEGDRQRRLARENFATLDKWMNIIWVQPGESLEIAVKKGEITFQRGRE